MTRSKSSFFFKISLVLIYSYHERERITTDADGKPIVKINDAQGN